MGERRERREEKEEKEERERKAAFFFSICQQASLSANGPAAQFSRFTQWNRHEDAGRLRLKRGEK